MGVSGALVSAALRGCLSVLKWLRSNGCPWVRASVISDVRRARPYPMKYDTYWNTNLYGDGEDPMLAWPQLQTPVCECTREEMLEWVQTQPE